MVEQLWAPWRLEYVRGPRPEGCPLCGKIAADDPEDALIVTDREHSVAMLNLFPYNPGHIMVVPKRHVADLTDLTEDESSQMQLLLRECLSVLRSEVNCDGANVGLNLGSAAGAGIADHLHWHVVPRWSGDTNFMPVIGETKVMAQHHRTTLALLRHAFGEPVTNDPQ